MFRSKNLPEIATDRHGNVTSWEGLTEAMRAVIECAFQAPGDLCGEQREFYLPRLQTAMTKLGAIFPAIFIEAMSEARDAWGDKIAE